jgi:hypothetical protein
LFPLFRLKTYFGGGIYLARSRHVSPAGAKRLVHNWECSNSPAQLWHKITFMSIRNKESVSQAFQEKNWKRLHEIGFENRKNPLALANGFLRSTFE